MQELKKHVSSTFFGVILVCFFTPFIEVSCNETKIASPSGWHFITGNLNDAYNKKNTFVKKLSDEALEGRGKLSNSIPDKQPNIFVIISFIAVIIGLLESIFKWSSKSLLTISLIGLTSHLIFYFIAKSNIDEKLKEIANDNRQNVFSNLIHIDFSLTFLLSIALFIAIVAFNIQFIFEGENHKLKKCPFCAEDIKFEAIVCKHCGREILPIDLSELKSSINENFNNSKSKKYIPFAKVYILPIFLVLICSTALYMFIIFLNQ